MKKSFANKQKKKQNEAILNQIQINANSANPTAFCRFANKHMLRIPKI